MPRKCPIVFIVTNQREQQLVRSFVVDAQQLLILLYKRARARVAGRYG